MISDEMQICESNLVTPKKIEAYGVKGVKSTPWRKIFPTSDALNRWVEKNDAEVFGTREVE